MPILEGRLSAVQQILRPDCDQARHLQRDNIDRSVPPTTVPTSCEPWQDFLRFQRPLETQAKVAERHLFNDYGPERGVSITSSMSRKTFTPVPERVVVGWAGSAGRLQTA